MRFARNARNCASLVVLLGVASSAPARGEGADAPEAKWGFTRVLGQGGAGGDFGNLFERPISGEFDFFHQSGPWRFGVGVSFGSFKMQQPYHDELEWGFLQTYLFGTRMLRQHGVVRPYIQARGGLARLHPRSFLFAPDPLPEGLEPGDSPTKPANGFSVGVVPGMEFRLNPSLAIDTSFSWTYFKVDEYDLSPVGQPPRSSGSSWEARVGATWHPHGGDPEGTSGERDGWGVHKSYGWAAGELLAINLGAGLVNEYVRNANFNQTSPRSWWANIEEGFTYDDNQFKTNQWGHPFNGATYYNSGRSNGLGFWPSYGFALAGAFNWECCGETHPMSLNDLIATGIGGAALGEAQYRLSSEILNNQSQGIGRFLRELGGFFVDPIRGFNRQLSGDGRHTASNPVDPMDWRPPGGTNFVAVGARVIGEGSSITENTQTYATVLLNHAYGNVFENERRKPFDYMAFVGAMDFGEKVKLDNVQIKGNLASWPLGSRTSPNHVIAITQSFDYMNNTAYEFGGQSVGGTLFSRFRLSDKLHLTTRLDVDGIIMGAVNADYSWLADVAEQERIREYDYGPGLGAAATATLHRSGHPILTALYRFAWINVTNGSVYDKGSFGSAADHYIQGGGVRLFIPVKGGLGIGGDAFLFFRKSDYSLDSAELGVQRSHHVDQRNPQARIYLALNSVR